jgi:Mor family transcriptional regulator
MPIILATFNRSVNMDGPIHPILNTKCHLWTGIEKHYHGIYGKQSAHRVIWEHHNGAIPNDKCIRHKCDNGLCVNISHLELGTRQDNIRDMNERGRASGGGARGERTTTSKLKRQDVLAIKANFEERKQGRPNLSNKEMVKKYKVSERHLYKIRDGLRWADTSEQPTKSQQFLNKAKPGSYNEALKSACLEMPTARQICRYNNISTSAHRIAYIIQYGSIPEGMFVLHKCDNAKCINHEHLELGNHEKNMTDRDERGRTAKGENHGTAKLTAEQVKYIFDNPDNKTNTELAGEYNISVSHIGRIKQGKVWKGIISTKICIITP